MIRSHGFGRQHGMILSWGLLIPLAFLTLAPAPTQSQQQFPSTQGTTENHAGGHRIVSAIPDDTPVRNDGPQPLSTKQKLSIVQANFEKAKSDAAAMAALAKELREELDKPNINVLSSEVINRAEKIEKLAKKIREETKGY
ncbi:MAG: hypothetical protein ABSA59_21130 [Terriglobia bacterium]